MNTNRLDNCLLSNFCNLITLQLNDTNYVTWRFMLESMLVGFDLMGYIDGSVPCPLQYKNTETGITPEFTQEYKYWRKNDSALITLLAATLSSDSLSFIVGSKTSKEVWFLLEERYAKLSKFKAFELQNSMQKIQKGNDSIDKYMERFKTIRDKLSLAGVYISDEDIVTLILNGLPVDFSTIKIVIRASKTPITLSKLRTLLLDFEFDIVQESRSLASAPLTTSVVNHENQSPGTHFTTKFACVPQHTIMPNNTNYITTSGSAMNTAYAANAMMQNGNFGLPYMSSTDYMMTVSPSASDFFVHPPNANIVHTSPYLPIGFSQHLGSSFNPASLSMPFNCSTPASTNTYYMSSVTTGVTNYNTYNMSPVSTNQVGYASPPSMHYAAPQQGNFSQRNTSNFTSQQAHINHNVYSNGGYMQVPYSGRILLPCYGPKHDLSQESGDPSGKFNERSYNNILENNNSSCYPQFPINGVLNYNNKNNGKVETFSLQQNGGVFSQQQNGGFQQNNILQQLGAFTELGAVPPATNMTQSQQDGSGSTIECQAPAAFPTFKPMSVSIDTPTWQQAILKEINSVLIQGTLQLHSTPPDRQLMNCR